MEQLKIKIMILDNYLKQHFKKTPRDEFIELIRLKAPSAEKDAWLKTY